MDEREFVSKDIKYRFYSKTKKEEICVHAVPRVESRPMVGEDEWILVKKFKGVCRVVEFRYIGKSLKSKAERRTNLNAFPFNDDTLCSVGMLCRYFTIDQSGALLPANVSTIDEAAFLPLSVYKAHLPPPTTKNYKYFYDLTRLSEIMDAPESNNLAFSPEKAFAPGFGKSTTTAQVDDDDFGGKKLKKTVSLRIDKKKKKIVFDDLKKKKQTDEEIDEGTSLELRAFNNIKKRVRAPPAVETDLGTVKKQRKIL